MGKLQVKAKKVTGCITENSVWIDKTRDSHHPTLAILTYEDLLKLCNAAKFTVEET